MSGRDTSMNEIWILGATGRAGRSIATQLAARHMSPVLVGRDQTRLRELAGTIGGTPRILVAGSVDAVVTELARATPAVVINTIGPFMETALPIVRACPPGTHYVDLANELLAVTAVLGLHDQAVAAGRSLVTGAGFGVLATESVVLKLCEDRPGAARVRVDAVPMVEAEAGLVGPALAGSLLDGFAVGGRRYQGGRLVRARLGSDVERLTLPDGSAVQTIGVPTGELEAAGRASGAPFAVAASSEVPSGRAIRAILPAVAALLSLPALRNVAKRRLARVRVGPSERRREFSWAHARVEWPDGSIREGWLRAGEGMAFTAAVAAEVASRLGRNEGRPGAYTPGSLFGPDLATDAGGQFILEESLAR
jgi:short subunit dehydrogenase-like uncharacterized protein